MPPLSCKSLLESDSVTTASIPATAVAVTLPPLLLVARARPESRLEIDMEGPGITGLVRRLEGAALAVAAAVAKGGDGGPSSESPT